MEWKAEDDGVIRLRSFELIRAAHADKNLIQVEGWQRGTEIYGGFVFKVKPLPLTDSAPAVVSPKKRKKS